jgi:hypothetical protein
MDCGLISYKQGALLQNVLGLTGMGLFDPVVDLI